MTEKTKSGLFYILIGGVLWCIGFSPTLVFGIISNAAYIGFVGAIIGLVGFIQFVRGRKEFGDPHHRSVRWAMFTLLYALISFGVGVVLIIAARPAGLPVMSLMGFFLTMAAWMFTCVFEFFIIYRLQDRIGTLLLVIAVLMGISAVFTFVLAGPNVADQDWYLEVALRLNVGGSGFFVLAIWYTYMRIHTGALVPGSEEPVYTGHGYPCPICKNPMRYIPAARRPWCDNCGRSF